MRRNRSIRTLPQDLLSNHPPLEQTPNRIFGEKIAYSPSSDDSLDAFFASCCNLESQSSSSSLSWGGETKSEASKLLQQELARMDRVLRGEETIPANYDADEYNEWMEFFPNLCVTGVKVNICDNINSSLDSCLHISKLAAAKLPKRQNSSRSLMSSHYSAAKWLKDDDFNCNSLPFISGVRGERKGLVKGQCQRRHDVKAKASRP